MRTAAQNPDLPADLASPTPKKRKRLWLVAGGIAAVVLLALVTGIAWTLHDRPSRLQTAATSCNGVGSIQDSGQSWSISAGGKESNYTYDSALCVLRATKAPDFVMQHIGATRALDGMQEDQWDGFKARWTYHPDNGLHLMLVDAQDG